MVTTVSRRVLAAVTEVVLTGAKQATKYLSPQLTVKATFHGARDARYARRTIVLTVGTPNYRERAFIKKCQAVGEPFPVRKLQLRW
jgi:hypothetical protein